MNTQIKRKTLTEKRTAPADRALGTYCGKGCEESQTKRLEVSRLERRAMKHTAASLLRSQDEKHARRLSACMQVAHGSGGSAVSLYAQKSPDGTTRAHFSGLITCQSTWCCPDCASRIAEDRRKELNDLLSWARSRGHRVVMLTLTARHNKKTALKPFLADLKDAAKALRQSTEWRELGLIGNVAATEVTHGANGFHPHQHILMIFPASVGDAVEKVERLRARWLHVLKNYARNGNQAAFHVQSADAAGDYIAKFGPAEEMALQSVKEGRKGSRTPWQLLRDATHGDRQAGVLFREYAAAFKGRVQLQWSRGLKKLLAEETEESGDDEPEPEKILLRQWHSGSLSWARARRRMVAILRAAESGGCIDAAERGKTDSERWRDLAPDGQVLEAVA